MLSYFRSKKGVMPVLLSLAAVFIFSGMWYFSVKTPAYAVLVDGKQQFVVKDRHNVDKALEQLSREQSKKFDNKVDLASDVKIKRQMARRNDILSSKKVLGELRQALKTPAVAIVIKGKAVAYVENRTVANALLNELKKQYAPVESGEKLVSVKFQEKVELKNQKVHISQIKTRQQAIALITTGSDQPKKYTVKEGDSLWWIARKNDMLVDEIKKANHLQGEDLKPGDELVLLTSEPYINVIAMVEGQKTESIPFTTKTIVDKKLVRSVKVKQEGQNGEKQVVYTATKYNGVVAKKNVIEEKVLKAAVDKIIVKGSRVVQIASRGGGGSGNLSWPASGSITQGYGGSGGHTGIDIGASSGSAIRAAAGGTVTFAGYEGGYGKFIIINHGNGLVTRYAHCSSLLVSDGQSVSAGETIGRVGSTGHSTGPHLHFEVLSGGSFRNPFSYLR
ncbi:MAG: peptidoglycan DD-metalloendopeptidase family protein [Syntrophomonas sp.]